MAESSSIETAAADAQALAEQTPEELKAQADKLVAEGKKAIALKRWDEATSKYADALDIMRQLVGEFDPTMAPLLLSYGKALYEVAYLQAGVMGKEEVDKQTGGNAAREQEDSTGKFVFSGDAASDDEEEVQDEETQAEGDEPQAGPSETKATAPTGDAVAEGGEDEEVEEPEDDWNAAWEVLDVARTIYAKIIESKDNEEARADKLCLADCLIALGDVSCETENFPQAVQDYSSALEIQSALLPPSSRALASVHYQLATVLEFTPNRRADALSHVVSALDGFKLRLSELSSPSQKSNEEVSKLSEKDRESEKKEVEALIGDLEVKIEELKAAPPPSDFVSESINHLLGQDTGFGAVLSGALNGGEGSGSGAGSSAATNAPVNDLTSMVKKKPKKTAEANGKGKAADGAQANGNKRAVEGGENGEASEAKKVKLT